MSGVGEGGGESTPGLVRLGRQILRRAPLLVVLAVLAWLYLGERPREVTLAYDLPDDPAPTRVEVVLRGAEGETAAAISWGSEDRPAADRREHRALLPPGIYRLHATLTYPDGTTRQATRSVEIGPDDRRIVLHLSPR